MSHGIGGAHVVYYFYEDKGLSIRADYGTSLEFGAHFHRHLELVYMLNGSAKGWVDSREYLLSTGDVFLVFPNQIHQYEKIGREDCIVCIFPPEICPDFQGIFNSKIPASPLVQQVDASVLSTIEQIVAVNEQKPPFWESLLKGYFLILLSHLFGRMRFTDNRTQSSDTIQAILNYCAAHYTADIRLETISQELHISKYYISHLFSEKLHIGFQEYIAMLRISEACRLLTNEQKSITEIAYLVGFNSTRSFNRAFLKHTKQTPRQYRQNAHTE